MLGSRCFRDGSYPETGCFSVELTLIYDTLQENQGFKLQKVPQVSVKGCHPDGVTPSL